MGQEHALQNRSTARRRAQENKERRREDSEEEHDTNVSSKMDTITITMLEVIYTTDVNNDE